MRPVQLSNADKLELKFLLSDGSYSSCSFIVEVVHTISDTEFIISPPFDSKDKRWHDRCVQVIAPKKGTAYSAEGTTSHYENGNGWSLLKVVLKHDFLPYQRRRFPRLKVALNVFLEQYGIAKTVDISASGIAFVSEFNFVDGDEICGTLCLEEERIPFTGFVVRCTGASDRHNLVCLSFSALPEANRASIMRFVDKNS